MTSTGMSKEMYEHILKNKHLIDIDLDNGVVTTPKGTHGTLCSSTGYLRVKLNKKLCQVHQIIAVCLYGEDCVGMQVNHINADKQDNRPDNIELLSIYDNIKEQLQRNKKESKGTFKNSIKVIATNIETNEKLCFESMSEARRVLKVHASEVRAGRQKTSKGYTLEFIES